MTRRPVLWCCLIEFSITWWKTRECGRKGCFDSILVFLGRSPADWAAEAVGFLLCLPSDRHSQLTRCPPTVWLGSLCPSLSYGDEEFLVFVPRFLSQGPHPVLPLSVCGHMSHFIARRLSHADREGVGMGDYKYLPPSIHMSHAPGGFPLPVRILLQL